MKKRRAFLSSMAKLDDNIVYLCFSQVSEARGKGRGGEKGVRGGGKGVRGWTRSTCF